MNYKSNIWKMYAYKLFRSMHFIGGVLVPFFTDWGGITFTQLMLLEAFFTFSVFALEIPTGTIADYLGRKTSLIMAVIVNALAAITMGIHPSMELFVLGEFLWAASVALMSGADQALVYDSLKKIGKENKASKIFARLRSFDLISLMIAAPIGSIIAATLGLQYTMLFLALPLTIAAIIGFTLKEPKTKRKVESKRYLNILIGGMKYFRNHKTLRILAMDSIMTRTLAFFIIWMYQPLLQSLGIKILYFGIVHTGLVLTEIIVMNKFEFFEKLLGKKGFLLWSAIITGIAFIMLGINYYIPLTIILIMITGGFGLSRHIYHQSLFNKHIESHNRATVLSTISMLHNFVRGIAYPIIGILVEISLRGAFIILGILLIITAIMSRVREEHLI